MNHHHLTALLILIFLPLTEEAFSQERTLIYDIIKGDNKIGEITAVRTEESEGKVSYKMHSSVRYSFIKKINLDMHINMLMHDGMMLKADSKEVLNESPRASSSIWWNGDDYMKKEDDENALALGIEPVHHTTMTIYFSEPSDLKHVFSERHSEYLSIKKLGNHRYELTTTDGKSNIYTYTDGICTRVDIDHWFADFSFVLRK